MHSLTSALDGGEWSASRPGRFTPRNMVSKRKIRSPRRESNLDHPIVHLLIYAQSGFRRVFCLLAVKSFREIRDTGCSRADFLLAVLFCFLVASKSVSQSVFHSFTNTAPSVIPPHTIVGFTARSMPNSVLFPLSELQLLFHL
jgi:hypothetical protein